LLVSWPGSIPIRRRSQSCLLCCFQQFAASAARNVDQPETARRDGLRLSASGLALGLPAGLLAVPSLVAADDDVREVSVAAVTAIAAIDPAVTLRRQ
jgi:hypothetical protein